MSLEGALRIALTLDEGRISHVAIASTRPVQASRIFHGREIHVVSTLMPRLFSVCATAQACAASHALAAARGRALSEQETIAHGLQVLMETAQEHAWRLCVDGARLTGDAPHLPAAAAARALLGTLQRALFPATGTQEPALGAPGVTQAIDALEALLAQEPFGAAPEEWCGRLAERRRWWERDQSLAGRMLQTIEAHGLLELGNVPPAFLQRLDGAALDSMLSDARADSIIAAPTLDGVPRETTPLSRHWDDPVLARAREEHGAGLATRFGALLLELARIPEQMRALLAGQPRGMTVEGFSPAPGRGIAQVQAARGLLVHRVELSGDTVARYQILAPTEWNFHPGGIVVRALRGLPVRDAAEAGKASELIIQAIDPCVGFEVTLHA